MGVRLTPVDSQPFHCSETFKMQVTSAETNVASIVSYLGLPVKVLTAFVKDSPVARMIKDNLASRHFTYEGPEIEQGGPWGYRHQFNLADSGFGSRGPRVQNDRSGEVGRLLDIKYFDLERIFGCEGVQIVHLSGLIGALSPQTSKFCLELARAAKKYGSKISFDLNHRASFWEGREQELGEIFAEIASISDVLIGNEEDLQMGLGLKGPEVHKADKLDPSSFYAMMETVSKRFPSIKAVATTMREVKSTNRHRWSAVLYLNGKGYQAPTCDLDIYDRVGGGDGFASGLIYGLLDGRSPEEALRLGWAHGALLTSYPGDTTMATLAQVEALAQGGSARIQR